MMKGATPNYEFLVHVSTGHPYLEVEATTVVEGAEAAIAGVEEGGTLLGAVDLDSACALGPTNPDLDLGVWIPLIQRRRGEC
jgi:hypothetical protein